MAEDVTTQTPTLPESSPAPADNDGPAEGGAGPEVSSPESSPAQDALWTRLGYQSPDELESTHSRYKQQVQGSLQEQRRLQEAVAERDRRLQEYERRLMGPAPAAPQAPTELGFAQAVEAYLNGDQQALATYEQQQQQRSMRLAQEQVLSTLGTVVKPAQYSDAVLSEFPDLNDPKSPMYAEVWKRYNAEAAHPRYKLFYAQDDPGAYRDAWSPDGVEQRRVDMRIIYPLALKVAADLARSEGRRDETRRRATAGAAGGPGTPPPQAAQEAPLLYEDEIINDPRVRASMAALGKGTDPRTMRNWYWKNMPEREKRRRQSLHEGGQWTGRRGA